MVVSGFSRTVTSPDSPPRGAVEQFLFGAAPALHDAIRTASVGDPKNVGAIGDLVNGGKGSADGGDSTDVGGTLVVPVGPASRAEHDSQS